MIHYDLCYSCGRDVERGATCECQRDSSKKVWNREDDWENEQKRAAIYANHYVCTTCGNLVVHGKDCSVCALKAEDAREKAKRLEDHYGNLKMATEMVDNWPDWKREAAGLKPKDKKWDEGKPAVGQMKKDFSRALLAVADITSYGIQKYNQPGSWRYVENALERYEDAHGRHDLQMATKRYDKESKRLHAAHRAWNALATLELILEKEDEEA